MDCSGIVVDNGDLTKNNWKLSSKHFFHSYPPNISHPRNGPNYVRIPYMVSFGGVFLGYF